MTPKVCEKHRKKVVLSVKDKLEVLRRINRGEKRKALAEEYGVGVSTLYDWEKQKDDLQKWGGEVISESFLANRKTMRHSEYEKTGHALFLWFSQFRKEGVPFTGDMLKEKAIFFQNEFKEGCSDFQASDGWLTRWKNRYGVRQLQISGEILSSNVSEYKKFKETFQKYVEDEELCLHQIYNCDETGLNFKSLPSKTLASYQEKGAQGYKKNKERLTVLGCSNASGEHKIKLMIIGKFANPRAFKHINKDMLPVTYTHQKSAWMDRVTFKKWVFDEFVPLVEIFLKSKNLPRKAVLLLDC